MAEERSIEEIEAEIEAIRKAKEEAESESQARMQETYAKAKAESEIKEIADISQDSRKTIQYKLNTKVAQHIDNSVEVQEKIEKTADKLVEKGLMVQENRANADVTRSEDEILQADYEKNQNEYMYHGINHKIDKEWKRKLIHVINDVWFVIWAIISCFTIVPISTFLGRITALRGFMKWVAIILGCALLLACLGGLTYGCLKWTGVVH